jgi:hypothetical protein
MNTIFKTFKLSHLETPSTAKTSSNNLCRLTASSRPMVPDSRGLSKLECRLTRKVTMLTIEIMLRNSSNQIRPLPVQLNICKTQKLPQLDLGPRLHLVLQSSPPLLQSSYNRIKPTNSVKCLRETDNTLRNNNI